MKKSVHRKEYPVFCDVLREVRKKAGLTQVQMAKKFRKPQSFASLVESGKIRLDFLQLRDWCRFSKTSVASLSELFEVRLREHRRREAEAARLAAGLKRG